MISLKSHVRIKTNVRKEAKVRPSDEDYDKSRESPCFKREKAELHVSKVGASTFGEKDVRPVRASFDEPESHKFICGSTSRVRIVKVG